MLLTPPTAGLHLTLAKGHIGPRNFGPFILAFLLDMTKSHFGPRMLRLTMLLNLEQIPLSKAEVSMGKSEVWPKLMGQSEFGPK